MNWKARAAQLKTDIPALWLCLRAKETPLLAKVLAAVTVGYALSPVDLIPDFIPVLGYLDDILLLPALVALTLRCIPKETLEHYRANVRRTVGGREAEKVVLCAACDRIVGAWTLLAGEIVPARRLEGAVYKKPAEGTAFRRLFVSGRREAPLTALYSCSII